MIQKRSWGFAPHRTFANFLQLSSHIKSYYFRPAYPVEELEEETVPEDDAELTLNKVDEEFVVCVLLNKLCIFTLKFLSTDFLDFRFLEYGFVKIHVFI